MQSLYIPSPRACNAMRHSAALDKAGIEYTKVDIADNEQAHDYVMSLGYLQAPVVYVSPTEHWSGFRPDRLRSLTDSAA